MESNRPEIPSALIKKLAMKFHELIFDDQEIMDSFTDYLKKLSPKELDCIYARLVQKIPPSGGLELEQGGRLFDKLKLSDDEYDVDLTFPGQSKKQIEGRKELAEDLTLRNKLKIFATSKNFLAVCSQLSEFFPDDYNQQTELLDEIFVEMIAIENDPIIQDLKLESNLANWDDFWKTGLGHMDSEDVKIFKAFAEEAVAFRFNGLFVNQLALINAEKQAQMQTQTQQEKSNLLTRAKEKFFASSSSSSSKSKESSRKSKSDSPRATTSTSAAFPRPPSGKKK